MLSTEATEANASQQVGRESFRLDNVNNVALSKESVFVEIPRSDLPPAAVIATRERIPNQSPASTMSEDNSANSTTERSTLSPSNSNGTANGDSDRRLSTCDPVPPSARSPCSKRATSPSPQVVTPAKKKAKRSCPERKKAPDAPRRPLSAYNIFFLVERERLLNETDQVDFTYDESLVEEAVKANLKGAKTKKKRSHRKSHGKIAFKDLATAVSERWKALSPVTKALFEKYATNERNKYKKLMEIWQKQRKKEVVDAIEEEAASKPDASQKTPPPAPKAKVVSPTGEETSKPLKIIDSSSPFVPSFPSRDDSLTAMMRRGQAYTMLVNQKQAELELQNSMLDHMQMMMSYSYPVDAVSPDCYESCERRQFGVPSVPSNAFSLMAYAPHSEYNQPVDYYDAADATFQLAHQTLPPPPAHCFSTSITAAYPAPPSHASTFENAPFVDSFDHGSASHGFLQAQEPNGAGGYELNPAHGYNDTQYSPVVDAEQPVYGANCEVHVPHEQYVPTYEAFPNTTPAVRALQAYEPMAYDLDDTSDEDDDEDDDSCDVADADVESIMGVLNPSADPFSLASVFE